jgi:hypothetical protein
MGMPRKGAGKGQDPSAEYRRHRRIVRLGQAVMAVGVVVGLVHLVAHWGTFGGDPSGTVDLLAGYPMAAVLLIAGGVAAGRAEPRRRR